jgi:PAS domain S-box-containing protein
VTGSGQGEHAAASLRPIPAVPIAVTVLAVLGVADLIGGKDVSLADIYPVAPCLAAAAATWRQVLSIGGAALALCIALAIPDDLLHGRETAYSVAAIVAVTVIGAIIAMRRGQIEAAEAASNARARGLAAIVDQSDDAILSHDLDGLVTSWNRGAEAVYGYPPADMVGSSYARLVPDDLPDEFEAILRRVRDGGRLDHFESVRVRRDGERRDVSETVSPLVDDAGSVVGASVVSRDVTVRNEMTAQLQALERRMQQSERMDSLGQLAGGVAHDFNNLLAVILNYASLLRREVEGERANRDVQAILTAVDRAAALTGQLLTFSSSEPSHPTVIDINDVVVSVTDLLGRTLPANIRVVTHLDEDAWQVLTDTTRVEQLVMNLAINARDAMPDGGTITIETSNDEVRDLITVGADRNLVPGRYLRLAISDDGTGMTSEVSEHAFEPFFTTKPRGQGTGLGLATVYGIVRQMGGDAAIYSEPGKGTTIRLHLPATTSDPHEDNSTNGAVPRRSGRGECVLLVEDEEMLREALVRVLEEAGYTVEAAGTAEEALAKVESEGLTVDLLISDVMLPGMSGPELADELRSRDGSLAVLFATGYTQRSLDLGTNGASMIEKPFSLETFLERVGEALGDREG